MIRKYLVMLFPSFVRKAVEWRFRIKNSWRKPEAIELNNGLKLFADWDEPRGRSLIMGGAKGQPNIKLFWKQAGELIKPNVFLDVGANYGEVLFSTNYPQTTKLIVGVEANPFLFKFLNKTLNTNPYKEKVILLNNLASDTTGIIEKFYIDKKSSGRSTALKNNFVKDVEEVEVESIRLDDYIMKSISNIDSLVFKIDVEGFEPFVLKGLEKLMQSGKTMVGCIEINLSSLINNNIDLGTYFGFINTYFKVGILHRNGKVELLKYIDEVLLRNKIENKHAETDLILYTSEIDIDTLITMMYKN